MCRNPEAGEDARLEFFRRDEGAVLVSGVLPALRAPL